MMALDLKLDVKLTQKLVLTPQLRQAIKLLQLPQLDLIQEINQELETNPFLEENIEEEATTLETENNSDEEQPIPLEKLMTFRVDDYFDERSSDGRDLGYFNPGLEEPPSFENFLKKTESLYDHLTWQLHLLPVKDNIRAIAETIIGNLDENGYFKMSIEDVVKSEGVSVEEVEEALRVVQQLDPPGIGARDLQECLLLQLRDLGLQDSLVARIVRECMRELERKDYKGIARKLGATLEDVLLAVDIISGLDPKPGRNLSSSSTEYVTPDVIVEKVEGEYRIVLNDSGIPKLRLNNYYKKLLLDKDNISKEERKFLTEKLRAALWLVKSLDQRNKTIYRVTESILRFQREFFDKGPEYIKPLNLRDVAEDINMHESTVSRVTLNKYLQCSHGIFSFRYFFSNALKGKGGKVSSTVVKEMIRKIIMEENPQKPYSDQKIADILRSKNIQIARRTVAKYREELKIPSHTRRKKLSA